MVSSSSPTYANKNKTQSFLLQLQKQMGTASSPQFLSSLSCEITIMQAKNLESIKSNGNLFVRYYISAGNNKRIQLNSREIPSRPSSNNLVLWNESFSLECLGTEDSVNNLKQENVVFELRWRNTNPIVRKIGASQLLGRGEISWKTVMESPNMEMEKWVVMVPKKGTCGRDDGVKPPSVKVSMRVRVPDMVEVEKEEKKNKRRNGRLKKWNDECGCCEDSGCRCQDYEIFALAAALEAL